MHRYRTSYPAAYDKELTDCLRLGCVYQENGLKVSNSWAGYHILLNPDYSAQILWRFVNRAIDEVENCQVTWTLLMRSAVLARHVLLS